MYLHHPLWLLPLFVAGGARNSRKEKNYQYDNYYDDDYESDYINDKDYSLDSQMYDDNPPANPSGNKLLIIVLGGFRWDYFQIYRDKAGHDLEGFKQFIAGGVRARYLESVFPAESFPAWQTIQTGLYPESHGIVGNQFYDGDVHTVTGSSCKAFFNIDDERSTKHMKWWQKDDVEPIWATAAKNNVKFATYLWGRCDVPYDDVKRLNPEYCENYYSADLTKTLRINVDKALQKIQDGVDAAIIYDSTVEKAAEDYGPFSKEMDEKLRQLDSSLIHLESRLNVTGMKKFVNVVILSDHGMTYGHHSNNHSVRINKINLLRYLNREHVRWIVGSGSHAGVYPHNPKFRKKIVKALSKVEGVRVFERNDIPGDLHYRESRTSPPILVLAEPQTIILSNPIIIQRPSQGNCWDSRRGHQARRRFPPDMDSSRLMDQTRMGLAGYSPYEGDMRGIFLAQGPDFHTDGEDRVHPPIKLVDVYQLFTKLLGMPAQPNNGTWDNVKDMLVNSASSLGPLAPSICLSLAIILRTLSQAESDHQ